MHRAFVAVAVSFLLAPLVSAATQRAVVIDAEGKSVSAVDLASGKILNTVTVADAPYRAVLSPDGRVLAVLSRGEGSSSFWTSKFHPTSQSSATLLDARTLKQVSRTPIGWDIGDALFTSDSASLIVLAPGVSSDKPAEAKSGALVRVPVAGGPEKRFDLDRTATGLALTPDQRTAIVVSNAPKNGSSAVRFVALDSMTAAGDAQIPGELNDPTASADGKLIYVLEKGDGAKKLHIFSAADRREVQSIDAGENPQFAARDDASGRIFIISDGAPQANPRQGAILMLKGTDAARVDLDFKPAIVRLSDDRRTAFVVGAVFRGMRDAGRITAIDLARDSAAAPVNIMRGATDFLVSPDGTRAFVSFPNYLTVVDMQNGKQLTSFMTGSKGARFGQALLAAGATAASYQSGRSSAQASGKSSFYYTVYTPKIQAAARGPLVVRRDGKFAYALDTQTNYVTIADAATGERVENIRVTSGAHEIVPLGNGRFLAAVSDSGVSLIDTESNTKAGDDVKLQGELRDFVFTPSDDAAIALAKGDLVMIDAATGKTVAEFTQMRRPLQVVFPKD